MATGTPTNKTALKKGFGLMDWVKLTTSTSDLSGMLRMGGMRGYRMDEVAKHTSAGDAWAVFGGKVYNLTPYLPYHPGGAGIVVKAAGTDCTALFNKHHPWVNFEGLAGKLMVGYLIEEGGASNGSAASAASAQTVTATASSASAKGRIETDPPSTIATKDCKSQPALSVFAMDSPSLPPQRIVVSAVFGTGEESEEEGVEEQEVGRGEGR